MPNLSEEAKESLEALGHNVDNIEGGDLDGDEPGTDANAGQDPQVESPGQDPATQEPEGEGQDPQLPAAELSEEEQQRRTWQSERDAALAEAEQAKARESQIVEQNKQLLALLGGGNSSAAPESVQSPNAQESDKKPNLSDFIDLDQYDSLDAADPRTQSGIAKEQYDDAMADWRTRKAFAKQSEARNQEKRKQIASVQAQKLAKDHAEFRDVFGNPDMTKISNFIDGLAQSEDPEFWSKLYSMQKNGTQPQAPVDPAEIGRNASKTPRVAKTPAGETGGTRTPKTFTDIHKTFGDFEYPKGAEFE